MAKSIWDVQVLLGFANFYRRIIRKYTNVTLPLTELPKTTREIARTPKAPGKTLGKPNKSLPEWECTREAELAFRKLKKAFTDAPILQHFDRGKPMILQTEASGIGITGILNQYDGFGNL